MSSEIHLFHIPKNLSFSSFIAIFLPFSILSVMFLLDTRIHTVSQLKQLTRIPILGEVPFIRGSDISKIFMFLKQKYNS